MANNEQINNEQISYVFKKINGYPNTNVDLEYTKEPTSKEFLQKIYLNQVYGCDILDEPPNDIKQIYQELINNKNVTNYKDDLNNNLVNSRVGLTSSDNNLYKLYLCVELSLHPNQPDSTDEKYVFYQRDQNNNFIMKDFVPFNFGANWQPILHKSNEDGTNVSVLLPNTAGNEWILDKEYGTIKFYKKNFDIGTQKLYISGFKYVGPTLLDRLNSKTSIPFGVRYLSEKWIDAVSLENQDDSTEYNKGWLIPHNSGVNIWSKSTSNNGFPALMSSEMGYVPISQNVILDKIIWKSDPNFKFKLAIHIINRQKIANDATIVGPEYEKLANVIEINSSIGFHKFATEIAINEGNYIALEIYDIQNTSNDFSHYN